MFESLATKLGLWAPCAHGDCSGARLRRTPWCLVHVAEQDPMAFEAELKRIGVEGTIDARGVVINAELLARILEALPRKDDRPTFTEALFIETRFQGRVVLERTSFQGVSHFERASFDWVMFSGASITATGTVPTVFLTAISAI